MKYGAILNKDLSGWENPRNVWSADYGLAMIALKGGAPPAQRVAAMKRLLSRHGLEAHELLAQPDRSSALEYLSKKSGIRLTITPGIVEGFVQVLNALVSEHQDKLRGEIEQRSNAIKDIGGRLGESTPSEIVDSLLESGEEPAHVGSEL